MNHTSESRSSHEGRPSATPTPAAGTAVRETVINPEGRPASAEGSTSSRPTAPPTSSFAAVDPRDASLWRRLFPADTDPAGSDDVEAAADCELGHFAIEERIGSGGMGAVFRALDIRLQRVVALKVLAPAQSRDRAAVRRFQNEARAAARLDHENIARVFYIGEDRGLHFIAFEYITGQNVRDLIARTKRLRVADAVNNVLQIASALRHTAAAGVVHRDIKPSNIILAPNGRAKLVDLGLARKLTSDSAGDITVAGTTLGTFDYISPEQARDPRNVDVRSDIYSLGCTLFHMLTGTPPYSSGTMLQKLLDHQEGRAPDPRSVNSSVPPALAAICRKMMAGDPKNRYATPDELIRDLAVVASGLGLRPVTADAYIWTRPHARPRPKIRPSYIWAGSAAIVLALAALVDIWPAGRGGTDRPEPTGSTEAAGAISSRSETSSENASDAEGRSSVANTTQTIDPTETASGSAPSRTEKPANAPRNATAAPRPEAASDGPTTARGTDRNDFPARPGHVIPQFGPLYNKTRGDGLAGSNPSDVSREIAGETDGPAASDQAFQELSGTMRNIAAIFSPVYESMTKSPAPASEAPSSPSPDVRPRPDFVEAPKSLIAQFAVVSEAGSTSETADSLAEAISLADDGDTIELRFDGALPAGRITEPIRIAEKEITLRAGADGNNRPFEPVIELANNSEGTTAARMITIAGQDAGLAVDGVQFRMTIAEGSLLTEPAALFVLDGAAGVSLEDSVVTVDSPPRSAVSVFDLRPASDPNSQQPSYMNTGSDRDEARVRVSESFIRGSADLVTIGHTRPAQIEIRNSGIALQQSLISVSGGISIPAEADVEVTLDHMTAMLANPLLRVDLSKTSRFLAPLHITASNNVIATSKLGQLIFMNASFEGPVFTDALDWNGDHNVFHGFTEFWSVKQPGDGPTAEFPGTFAAWRQYWPEKNPDWDGRPDQSVTASGESIPLWNNLDAEFHDPVTYMPEFLRLHPAATQASSFDLQANDGSGLVGTDPDDLPSLAPPGGQTHAQTSVSP